MNVETGELAILGRVGDDVNDGFINRLRRLREFETEAEAIEAGFVPLDPSLNKSAEAVIATGQTRIPLARPRNRHERRLTDKRRRLLAKKGR